jgi:hypothetical protein
VLRQLAPHLRRDPHPPQLRDRGADGQRGGRDVGERTGASVDDAARERERGEGRDAAGERAEGERHAGRHGRRRTAAVAGGPDRLDHREAARRPRAGDPGEQRGGGEADRDRVGQHGTLVW